MDNAKMTRLSQITVGSQIASTDRPHGSDCLYVWMSSEEARGVIRHSPLRDSQLMSSTTYHRAATVGDVERLEYDENGNMIDPETLLIHQ
jgi:hypothetical protein